MDQTRRIRLPAGITLGLALALAWAALARWIVPPLLIAEHPEPMVAALKRSLASPARPIPRPGPDWPVARFSTAVLIAIVMQLTIVEVLRRYDRRTGGPGSSPEARAAASRSSFALAAVSAAFLAVTILAGWRQDYFLYIQMWFRTRRGDDPWFNVTGPTGGPR